MKCDICKAECDGKNHVRDPMIVQMLTVCDSCLNDFGNQDYDSLTAKLEKRKVVK